jgi:predicted TIM-barrel fold metal-dependent hydrolase
MFKLSKCSKTFIKLSGCFSEMPASLKTAPVDEIFLALQPYLVVILTAFGPFRIIFGTDWPVILTSLALQPLKICLLASGACLITPTPYSLGKIEY